MLSSTPLPRRAPPVTLNPRLLLPVSLFLSCHPFTSGGHLLGTGFATLILLLIAAGATALEFARIAGTGTGLLLAPYLLWLIYASGLNLRIWQLNSQKQN